MHYLVAILLVIWAICLGVQWAIQNWTVTLPILLGIVAVILIYIYCANLAKEEKRLRAESAAAKVAKAEKEEAERRKKAAHEANQHDLRAHLRKCVTSAEITAEEIGKCVRNAENLLTSAEHEFKEGAFAPFWDAVERAANQLAVSNKGINDIIFHSKDYRSRIANLDSDPPPFQVEVDALPDISATADRMRAIVRLAQRDFQFSTIYEQRKTNQLLTAGFMNLAEALSEMSDRVGSSIDSLAGSLSEIVDTNRANTEELIATVQKLRRKKRY